MGKVFNTTANCIPGRHYMVDLTERLKKIRVMVDRGDYFTMNYARQYGKTTTLLALAEYLKEDYCVLFVDFQMFSEANYSSEASFVRAFANELLYAAEEQGGAPENVLVPLRKYVSGEITNPEFIMLFSAVSNWCRQSEKPLVLIIDEADHASNYQVFLDFLSQLRGSYIRREKRPTFWSVILAGVHDIKNLKRKFVEPGEHSTNSPWNVSADFLVDLSFSPADIEGMLLDYEKDYATGMDVSQIAQTIYDYTSGYPFLVSRICKLLDERIAGTEEFPSKAAAWTGSGILKAVNMLLTESNALFESLTDKVTTYSDLRDILFDILMNGMEIAYNPDLTSISVAMMYGFVRKEGTKVVISNRIFETRLYNFFLSSEKERKSEIYRLGEREKYRFVNNGEIRFGGE